MGCKNIVLQCIENKLDAYLADIKEKWALWRNWQDANKGIVVMFGASVMGEKCCAYLEKMGILIDYICDNNSSKHGTFISPNKKSIEITSVEKALVGQKNVLCFVAAGSHHFERITEQLKEYDVNTVMKQYLDFYLESMIMFCGKEKREIIHKIEELFSFYEDEESHGILACHLKWIFELNDEKMDDLTFERFCVKPQYFWDYGKYLNHQQVMLDCGAFNGDTVEDLIHVVKYEEFEEYICFELDKSNFQILEENIGKLPQALAQKFTLYNKGVGSESKQIRYCFNADDSSIGANGEMIGQIVALDEECEGKKVTFIKMDVEGSEQDAIRGAKNIIEVNKPCCAISVYHDVGAFWEIPEMLRKYVPEYKFILKHHTDDWADTVCYAKLGEW